MSQPTATGAGQPIKPIKPRAARTDSLRLFRGLRLHLAALLAGLFFVFYLVTSTLIYELTAHLTENQVDTILRGTTTSLASEVSKSLNRGLFPTQFVTLTKLAQMYPKVSVIVLRDAQGNVIASTAPDVTRNLTFAPTATLTTDATSRFDWYRVITLPLMSPYHQSVGYLQMAINVDRDKLSLASLRQVLFVVGGVGILLSAVAGFILSKLSLRPAVKAWRQQEKFVADASHELRTPLTVMRLNLEIINTNKAATVEDNDKWLQSIDEEIDRLQRLTDQLLTLARADSGGLVIKQDTVDLDALTQKVTDALRIPAERKGLALRFRAESLSGGLTVRGDLDKLHQLLTILIDNAIKYTPKGHVEVILERQRSHAMLHVKDTGIGIDAEHLERVFDRFYRTDAARTKGTGGTGLGLSIARAIVAQHNGDIKVRRNDGDGCTFTVSLPILHHR